MFGALGTDVAMFAQAASLDDVDTSVNPFGDYTELQGAYVLLTSPSGNELASWSYSTGLLAGHGGLEPGGDSISRPTSSRAP